MGCRVQGFGLYLDPNMLAHMLFVLGLRPLFWVFRGPDRVKGTGFRILGGLGFRVWVEDHCVPLGFGGASLKDSNNIFSVLGFRLRPLTTYSALVLHPTHEQSFITRPFLHVAELTTRKSIVQALKLVSSRGQVRMSNIPFATGFSAAWSEAPVRTGLVPAP